MNLKFTRSRALHMLTPAVISLLLTFTLTANAGPGAHGPNGEHLDAPAAAVMLSTVPRLVANSESFELVAELRATELVIVVDRYETNEPVLGAKLEAESVGLKAVAAFRNEQGDYVVTDAALLKALNSPGEHGLVFTLVAGTDSDLLDGTLVAGASRAVAAQSDHGSGRDDPTHELERAVLMGGAIAVLVLLGGIAWRRQRRRSAHTMKGAL